MGYCFDSCGRLCCDVCGNAGGARKQRCPHDYCQAVACCGRAECKAKLADYRKTTCAASCKQAAAKWAACEQERETRQASGEFLRCVAVRVDGTPDCVKVWFRNGAGAELVRYMAHAVYDAFPLLECVSVEQFAAVGPVLMEAAK